MLKINLYIAVMVIALGGALKATGDIDAFMTTRFPDDNGDTPGSHDNYFLSESLNQREDSLETPFDTDSNETSNRNALKVRF